MAFLKHGLTTAIAWFLLAHRLPLNLTFLLSYLVIKASRARCVTVSLALPMKIVVTQRIYQCPTCKRQQLLHLLKITLNLSVNPDFLKDACGWISLHSSRPLPWKCAKELSSSSMSVTRNLTLTRNNYYCVKISLQFSHLLSD